MKNNKELVTISDIIEWDKFNWSKAVYFWERCLRISDKSRVLYESDYEIRQCKSVFSKICFPVCRTSVRAENSCDRNLNLLKDKKVLELGGRCGGLSLWAASLGADVICSDLENPENAASVIHGKYPELKKSIRYEAIDALNIPYEDHFDVICFKSVLGGVARVHENAEHEMFEQIHKALKSDGKLLFAENLVAAGLHTWARKMFRKHGKSWRYQQFEELRILCSKYFDQNYRTVGFVGIFGLNECMKALFGFLDSILFDWCLPENRRYIFIDFCTKK
ncbi:MAG: class I SAM-dependent methyltransferase [Planctomycetaceae bacterium]|jgi:2-polyprenyl-3-methyl-5-hydroxy-6-metoxy-1,4-benzoquinol methylase|nr:class I SAM-dependent methyltransferase [Planctomycetaceae bacterium]